MMRVTIAAAERLKSVDRTRQVRIGRMVRKSDGKEGLVPATYVDIDEDAADEETEEEEEEGRGRGRGGGRRG